MKTVLVELRFHADGTDVLQTIDDLNDLLVGLSMQLDIDILSVSHVHRFHDRSGKNTSVDYSSTCVFQRNKQTAQSIAQFLKKFEGFNAFEDFGKVSVVIRHLQKISK